MSLVRGALQPGLSVVKKTAPFYSAVDDALAAIKRPKGTGAEFYTELTKQPGVKKAELADRKLEQAFKAKGKMTKEEAQQVLKDNPPPKINERQLAEISDNERDDLLRDKMETSGYDKWDEVPSRVMQKWNDEIDEDLEKYSDYKTAGGQNYREILLKLPEGFSGAESNRLMALEAEMRRSELPAYKMQELLALQAKKQNAAPSYQSSHWKEDPNVLAHMRVQDRKGPNGEKILHVEEIQSDWHQAGRKKGYQYQGGTLTPKEDARLTELSLKNPSEMTADEHDELMKLLAQMPLSESERLANKNKVPDAPFKKNWHELAMKRLLNYAADNGYDSIAITPGAEQAKRYDLSKQLSEVMFDPNTGHLAGRDHNGKLVVAQQGVTMENLPDYIGKEGAQKILETPANDLGVHALRGADLSVGGEGMKGFYDKILPDYLNSFGKPYGAQVGQIGIRDPSAPSSTARYAIVRDADNNYLLQDTHTEQFALPEIYKSSAEAESAIDDKLNRSMKLHTFPITPEMRESIKQKGLPLYQQIGIPTAGAGAASQVPEQEEGMSGGGSVAKMAALAKLQKMSEEMRPRAEAVKSLIAKDANAYLRDVAPNSLTNAEIEAEIQRMAARAEASQPEVKKADGGAINFNTAPDMSDGGRIIQGAPFKRGGKVNMTTNRDTMFMELSNKKLKRK